MLVSAARAAPSRLAAPPRSAKASLAAAIVATGCAHRQIGADASDGNSTLFHFLRSCLLNVGTLRYVKRSYPPFVPCRWV